MKASKYSAAGSGVVVLPKLDSLGFNSELRCQLDHCSGAHSSSRKKNRGHR